MHKYENVFRFIQYQQLCATLGTTGACAFDNLMELGPICKKTIKINTYSTTQNIDFEYDVKVTKMYIYPIQVKRRRCGCM